MPLNFVNEGGGGAFVRFSVEDNEWLRSSEGGDLKEFDPSSGVLVDIANVQLGWLKLSGGRDWVAWPSNDPTQAARPTDQHKQGFMVKMFSPKLFGDEPVRELCTSQTGMNIFIKKLYEDCEAAPEFKEGKVPAIAINKATEKMKIGAGSTRVPPYEIKKWMDRPSELAGGSPVPPASAPATTSTADAASDDVSFEI